ncbi:uncharacterized protein LOC125560928 [Nematostella vectensis]|uniref:uncharacterized protein LOC125560928 n=1 Tax=Nematostella vectensis TaxID=45351 RepID=UPI0020774E34|nr:uncharacterized protein LOC125560928 [Nematostella vectensis]
MLKVLLCLQLVVIGWTEGVKLSIPILHMKLVDFPTNNNWETANPQSIDLAQKFCAIHLVQLDSNWNVSQVYGTAVNRISSFVYNDYINVQSPRPASNLSTINFHWSYSVPEEDIQGTELNDGPKLQFYEFGRIQELMLRNISKQMEIDLNAVARRLGVTVRDLSYSYDPARWEQVNHVMVSEGIKVHAVKLDLSGVDPLAQLVRLTSLQLQNATLSVFLELVPPLFPKKYILDSNTTTEMLNSLRISSDSSIVTIGRLVNYTTGLTSKDFGIIYNLTQNQYIAMEKATLLQISEACGMSNTQLMSMTLPDISRSVFGSTVVPAPCLILVREKGVAISALGVSSPGAKTALQLLLAATGQKWRQARLTESLELADWDILDSVTVDEFSKIANMTNLLSGSVSDLIAKMKTNGLSTQIPAHKTITKQFLENVFNISSVEVSSITGVSSADLQSSASPKLVETFLNATTAFFNITIDDIRKSLNVTFEELMHTPTVELQDVTPYVITHAVREQATLLNVSEVVANNLMHVFPDNGTIAQLKAGVDIVKSIIAMRSAYEQRFIQTYLDQSSVSDSGFDNMTILGAALSTSGFLKDQVRFLYGLNPEQMFILEALKIRDLQVYCGLGDSLLKSMTPFDLTAALVGLAAYAPSCKATGFYIAAKTQTLSKARSVCTSLNNMDMSLMRLTENCTGLTWRYSADIMRLRLQDWTATDKMTLTTLPSHTDLTLLLVPEKTFQYLLEKAVSARPDSSVMTAYREPVVQQLLDVFSTSTAEMSQVLGVSEESIGSLSLTGVVEQVINLVRSKYKVDLIPTAQSLIVSVDNLKFLAPTEWREVIPGLKQEILLSGSNMLNVTESDFGNLLLFANITELSLEQIKTKWDTDFKRILNGKNLAENKTISEIAREMGISNETLNSKTIIQFFNEYLSLTKKEMATLYKANILAVDLLAVFKFQEIPVMCSLSESVVNSKQPLTLLLFLTGNGDITSCRNLALISAMRDGPIDSMMSKFSLTLNQTASLLDFLERSTRLPWSNISLGLNVSVTDWPLFGALSIKTLSNITSMSVSSITSSYSFMDLGDIARRQITSQQKSSYHGDLVRLASSLFALNATEVCGACDIPRLPTLSILKAFLQRLGQVIFFDPNTLPKDLGYALEDFWETVPSEWPKTIPYIIPKSFANSSSMINVTENDLAKILGFPDKSHFLNMTLRDYTNFITTRLATLVKCSVDAKSVPLSRVAATNGIPDNSLAAMNVIDLINATCYGTSAANVSFIFRWSPSDVLVLSNYSLGNAAHCKGIAVSQVAQLTLMDLADVMLREVHGCPPPTPPPCRTGTVRLSPSTNCTDVNECSSPDICQSGQKCLNFFGGYQCVCESPGFTVINKLCETVLKYVITFTMPAEVFVSQYIDTSTPEYYTMKEAIQREVGISTHRPPNAT